PIELSVKILLQYLPLMHAPKDYVRDYVISRRIYKMKRTLGVLMFWYELPILMAVKQGPHHEGAIIY
ncbi:MAG: hypothetical protein JWR18_874, partial [Segetibacter sp.]|nr:hypothetical protein [Segetibacter sp.]